MGLVSIDPLISLAGWADVRFDLADQPESKALLIFPRGTAHGAVQAKFGEFLVEGAVLGIHGYS
jgi:hypothetical protein